MIVDVFLSYSSKDRERIRPLAEHLRSLRLEVFFDVESIDAAANWSRSIDQAIAQAKTVLVFWSQNSVESRAVFEEAKQGEQRGVLIPVLIEACKMPYGFAGASARDLRGWTSRFDQPEWIQILNDIGGRAGRPGLGEWAQARARIERHEEMAVASAQLRVWLQTYSSDPSAPDVRAFLEQHGVKLAKAEQQQAEKIAIARHKAAVSEQKALALQAAEEAARQKAYARQQREAARSWFVRLLYRLRLPLALGAVVALAMGSFASWRWYQEFSRELLVEKLNREMAPLDGKSAAALEVPGTWGEFMNNGEYVVVGDQTEFRGETLRTRVVETATGKTVFEQEGRCSSSSTSTALVCGSSSGDQPPRFFDVETGAQIDSLKLRRSDAHMYALSAASGLALLYAGASKVITDESDALSGWGTDEFIAYIARLEDQKLVPLELSGHEVSMWSIDPRPVWSVQFCGPERVAISLRGGQYHLFDTLTGRRIGPITAETGPDETLNPLSLQCSADGTMLQVQFDRFRTPQGATTSTSIGKLAGVVNFETGLVEKGARYPYRSQRLTAEIELVRKGEGLSEPAQTRFVEVDGVETGSLLPVGRDEKGRPTTYDVAYCPARKWVASNINPGRVLIWAVAEEAPRAIGAVKAQEGAELDGIKFSADCSMLLAVQSVDNVQETATVRAWRIGAATEGPN